jgi:hypothetical protein
MPSQRCSLCAVNYPPGRSECIRCGGPLWPCTDPVSENWADVDAATAGRDAMKVEMWRLHVLVEANYPVGLAEKLAAAGDVDLHQAVELVESGCPAEIAAKILL